jgi:hypothetical protein
MQVLWAHLVWAAGNDNLAVAPYYPLNRWNLLLAPPPLEESFGELIDGELWPEWPKKMDRTIFEEVLSASSSANKVGFDIVAYNRFVKKLRTEVRGRGIAPVYILESPTYFVEHLLPMFFAVPGWLVLLRDGEYSDESLRIAHEEFHIPRSAMLEVDLTEFDLFHCNRTLLIACTNNWVRGHHMAGEIQEKWDNHPMAVTLAHGVDEDPTYCSSLTHDPRKVEFQV